MKRLLSLLCCLVLLLALTPASFAANSDLVYSSNATLNASFVAYNTITVRSGVTVTITPASGFEILDGITVEPGGALICSGEGAGSFNFSIKHADAVVTGLDFYWKNRDTGEVRKVPGGWPAIAALDCWDFAGGWCPSFKWNASVQGWCLSSPMGGNPFHEIFYHTERDMNTALACADRLFALGLFRGTGTGADGKPIYELNHSATRAEAVTMLVRFLGKETEARAGSWETPFTDVAEWAKPYVGYAYANGLTYGISETKFGSNSTCSAQMYLTFLLRALGYTNEVAGFSVWNNAFDLAREVGIYSDDPAYYLPLHGEAAFWRADMVKLSWEALAECRAVDGRYLWELLVQAGAFTGEAFQNVR